MYQTEQPLTASTLKPFMTKGIGLLLVSSALIAGLLLDQQQNPGLKSLSYCYSLASILGVLAVTAPALLHAKNWISAAVVIVLAVVAWRISFFPIMVIAGFLTTIAENMQLWFTEQSIIFAVLFLIAALLHTFSTYMAIALIQGSISYIKKALMLIVAIPLALLAIAVSFVHQSDLEILPFSIQQNAPLAVEVSLPSYNPYEALLKLGGHSWQETTLYYAGLITYELVPKQGTWTQYTKGTLEQDLRNSHEISSRYFTMSHLNAFWLARK